MLDTIAIISGLFFLGGLFLVSMIAGHAEEPGNEDAYEAYKEKLRRDRYAEREWQRYLHQRYLEQAERIRYLFPDDNPPSPTGDGRENQPETAEPDGRK